MKKLMLIFTMCLFLFVSLPLSASANSVDVSDGFEFRDGYFVFTSPFPTHQTQSFSYSISRSSFYCTYRIPVSDVPEGSYFVLSSPFDCYICSTFFWSTSPLFPYWPSSGTYTGGLTYNSTAILSRKGDSNSMYLYDTNSLTFSDNVVRSSGYYFISFGFCEVDINRLFSISDIDYSLTLVKPGDPDPEPEPDPEPTDPGEIGDASDELGDFGTDDGTQNDVYGAFKRLYDSLIDIASDESVPDDYEDNLTIPDSGAVLLPAGAASTYAAASGVRSSPVADYDASQFRVIAGNLGAALGQDTGGESVVYSLSPYAMDSEDSTQFPGDVSKAGHFFALSYRLELPYRFYFGNHKGTGQAITDVSFDFAFDFLNVSPDYWDVQFGKPSISILPSDSPVDFISDVEPFTSGTSNDVNDKMAGQVRVKNLNVPVLDYASTEGYRLVIDFPLYIYDNSPFVDPNMASYLVDVTLENMTFNECGFEHLSDSTTDGILGDIHEEQKHQNELENERYEEEQEKTQEAVDSVTNGLNDVTGTLSSWEIITMPVTLMKDFLTAITSEGSTVLTFPSFSVSGYTLWPSYSFDLAEIMERFSLLFNTLHIISGILVVIWFIRYLWRKWAVITGDDLPDGEEG